MGKLTDKQISEIINPIPTDDMINKIVNLTITWMYSQCLEHNNPTAYEFVKKHLNDEQN